MTEMPTWEQFMVPVLTVLDHGDSMTAREVRNAATDLVGLSDDQRTAMLPSGRVTRAADRISWAVHFLKRIEALDRPLRGTYLITDRGRELLASHPDGLVESDLRPFVSPGDEWWLKRSAHPAPADADDEADSKLPMVGGSSVLDPIEQVEQGVARINEAVASELLERLRAQDPGFFEEAVVELLLSMGYGGATGRGVTTARSHDGGIDGVIDQDRLGLDKVYVQAKRYGEGNAVQRPEVQGFVGALSGKADRGVFITTSRFSKGAVDYAEGVPMQIILIDGDRLAELMLEYGVGVQLAHTYLVHEIDEDFFT